MGLRFLGVDTILDVHPTTPELYIFRPIICGKGALIEGNAASAATPDDSLVYMVDGVAMVTREMPDRLQQIITQSWYWIGGFAAPGEVTSDITAPLAYKRAVVIEHSS